MQKYLQYSHSDILPKISAAVGQGRGEVWHCHSSGLLAVAAWSERKGNFLRAERGFEMFTLREWGHLLAEGKCQGFLPANVCLGERWETILCGLPEPSGYGALGSQSQTLNTKIRGQCLPGFPDAWNK